MIISIIFESTIDFPKKKIPPKKIPSAQLRCASKPLGSSKSLPIMVRGFGYPQLLSSLPSKHQLVKVQIWIKLSRVANHNLHMRNGQPEGRQVPINQLGKTRWRWRSGLDFPTQEKKHDATGEELKNQGNTWMSSWRNLGSFGVKTSIPTVGLYLVSWQSGPDLGGEKPGFESEKLPGLQLVPQTAQGHFPLHSIWGATKGSLMSPERRWMAQTCCLPTFRLCSKMKGPPNIIGRAIPETPTK